MIARRLNPSFFTALWLMPILTLVQVSLMGHFAIRGTWPQIILLAVVNWGILRGMDAGMLWALIGGFCLDLFSGWPMGTNTVALVVVASVVSLGEGTFMRTHALLPLATVFAATLLYYGIALFILASTGHPIILDVVLRDIVVPAAIYNAVLNIIGFQLAQRLERRVYPIARANW